MNEAIPFIDLGAQQARMRERLDRALGAVLNSGTYVLGPQVKKLESELSAFCGAKHAVTCANGTDALQLALMALGAGPGDAVFAPSFTFAATAEVVPFTGATPFFVDIKPDTFNMDTESLRRCVAAAREQGLVPKTVIPVDLFGLPAEMNAIEALAAEEGMSVICDTAQGFGGRINGQMTGTFGTISTTSFFPAKPLGCYGDGGALFTDEDELAATITSLRNHGAGSDRYDNVRLGINSRLDSMQAAILSVKLEEFPTEIVSRDRIAQRYSRILGNRVVVPKVSDGYESVWAQYTIRLRDRDEREKARAHLSAGGIPTAVYYPVPTHRQRAYRAFPADPSGLKVTDRLADEVLSLPMHPYLDEKTQDRIADTLLEALA